MSNANRSNDHTKYRNVSLFFSMEDENLCINGFRLNIRSFGFRTAPLMAARGAKEGNNALNKVHPSFFSYSYLKFCFFQDDKNPLASHSAHELFQFAVKNGCSREIYDFLVESFPNFVINHLNKRLKYSFFFFILRIDEFMKVYFISFERDIEN